MIQGVALATADRRQHSGWRRPGWGDVTSALRRDPATRLLLEDGAGVLLLEDAG